MKKIKLAVFFYLGMMSISLFFQSCGCENKFRIIDTGSIFLMDSSFVEIDTVRTAFKFIVNPELNEIVNFHNFGLINSSLAFQCNDVLVNNILPESITLSCNKEFVLSNEVIEANSNFINKDGIEISISDVLKGYTEFAIEVNSAFIQNSIFEEETYTFSINAVTDDDLELSYSIAGFMKIQN